MLYFVSLKPNKLIYMMKCVYCGKELTPGMYRKDIYGNVAHVGCSHLCFCCNRLVTSKDVKLPDNRWWCADCQQKAVVTNQHIEWVHTRVRKMLAVHGIDDKKWPKSLTINIVHPKFVPGREPTTAHKFGDTQYSRSLFSKSYNVRMLDHLHRIVFAGVLAHELLHVWQFEQGISLSRQELTEGFCNLGSWVVYEQMNTPLSKGMMLRVENDPTPIYGPGFRLVKAVYDNLGNGSLPDVMKELMKM